MSPGALQYLHPTQMLNPFGFIFTALFGRADFSVPGQWRVARAFALDKTQWLDGVQRRNDTLSYTGGEP